MTKEGEGMILLDGCPDHGTKYLYCVPGVLVIHEHCSIEGCPYRAIHNNRRKKQTKIEGEDRRKEVW